MSTNTNHAVIIAALPLRQRPTLYISPEPDRRGRLIILDSHDPEAGDALIGLAIPDGQGGWYLGCIECAAEITETDSLAMCAPCREEQEFIARQVQAALGIW